MKNRELHQAAEGKGAPYSIILLIGKKKVSKQMCRGKYGVKNGGGTLGLFKGGTLRTSRKEKLPERRAWKGSRESKKGKVHHEYIKSNLEMVLKRGKKRKVTRSSEKIKVGKRRKTELPLFFSGCLGLGDESTIMNPNTNSKGRGGK